MLRSNFKKDLRCLSESVGAMIPPFLFLFCVWLLAMPAACVATSLEKPISTEFKACAQKNEAFQSSKGRPCGGLAQRKLHQVDGRHVVAFKVGKSRQEGRTSHI